MGSLKNLSGFGRISNTKNFSPHCAIGAVAGTKSQPSAIALGWLFFSGENFIVARSTRAVQHDFDADAEVMTSTSKSSLRNAS